MKTKIEIGNLSDVGKVRSVNEDYFGSYSGKFGNLIIVCDGMGGHSGGAIASRLAVETIREHFEKLPEKYDEKEQLKLAIHKADTALKQRALSDPELKEMGSTAVLMLIKNDQAYCAHIGDSRIYMIRNSNIHQLTKDHSLVQQMVDTNMISEEAAKDHPKKNVITRSLGANGSSNPDIAEPFSVFKKDRFILCTDGLTGHVNDEEILQIVSRNSLQAASLNLIDLANSRGGKDNITVQIVSVISGKRLPMPRSKLIKNIQLGTAVALIILAIVAAIVWLPKIMGGDADKPTKKEGKNQEKTIDDKQKEKIEVDKVEDKIDDKDSLKGKAEEKTK